jgi:hypothetical protein
MGNVNFYQLGQAAARAHNQGQDLPEAYTQFKYSADIAEARKVFRAGYDSARVHKPEDVLLLRIVNMISEHRRGQGWPDDSEAYESLITNLEIIIYKALTGDLENE